MRIVIHGRKFSEASAPFVNRIIHRIEKNGASLMVTQACAEVNPPSQAMDLSALPELRMAQGFDTVDYIFSLGGDGTLLDAVRWVGRHETPILGINLGTLGFLATTAKHDIDLALTLFFQKQFTFDERVLLCVNSPLGSFKQENFAMNEVAILKRDTSSMIIAHCYVDGEFVNTYWADGVMVSTPTGSTGYSLSCGGPLVLPQSNSFIITPISPHHLAVRPLIVSNDSQISFKVEGKGRSFLVALDSRSYAIDQAMTLTLKKATFKARLISVSGHSFFETLRNKLKWGQDVRN